MLPGWKSYIFIILYICIHCPGKFVECMREQHVAEVLEYIADLQNCMSDMDTGKQGVLSVAIIRAVFAEVDPLKVSN